MTKIDIFSGFLGAGKTTLIKKLIEEAYKGEQIVLIENEFGEIGIDGGFLQDAGIKINEMNQGCICCSLVGDFGRALEKVMEEFHPERILIEPSGVGKLSDIITAVENLEMEDVALNGFTTVVDAKKAKMYMKNFGEFFNNQVEHASSIILSHTKGLSQDKLDETVKVLKEHNDHATIIATDWDELDGKKILEAMENKDTLAMELEHLEHEHHHHHHDHDEECECHEHHHHHHDHDEECECHHHHDHDHECDDPDCECHHHHHHHHADEIFASVGEETTHKFTIQQIEHALNELSHEDEYGIILRAKGIVEGEDGKWIHFDYVPGEPDVRTGSAGIIGRLCVIGSEIKEDNIKQLFGI
ncbi:MAG: GTP-binding protein [Clostridia bacterium]|nr:GTP-binding protein [Clostridia bacterium]